MTHPEVGGETVPVSWHEGLKCLFREREGQKMKGSEKKRKMGIDKIKEKMAIIEGY